MRRDGAVVQRDEPGMDAEPVRRFGELEVRLLEERPHVSASDKRDEQRERVEGGEPCARPERRAIRRHHNPCDDCRRRPAHGGGPAASTREPRTAAGRHLEQQALGHVDVIRAAGMREQLGSKVCASANVRSPSVVVASPPAAISILRLASPNSRPTSGWNTSTPCSRSSRTFRRSFTTTPRRTYKRAARDRIPGHPPGQDRPGHDAADPEDRDREATAMTTRDRLIRDVGPGVDDPAGVVPQQGDRTTDRHQQDPTGVDPRREEVEAPKLRGFRLLGVGRRRSQAGGGRLALRRQSVAQVVGDLGWQARDGCIGRSPKP